MLFLILIFYFQNINEFKGKVIDKESGELLIGANIYIENSTQGTVTDLNGEFVFLSQEESPLVKISYISYETISIRLKKEFNLLQLTPSTIISELVTVYSKGYTKAQLIVLNCIENYNEQKKNLLAYKIYCYNKMFFLGKKDSVMLRQDDSLRNIGKEDEIRKFYPFLFENYKEINWKSPDKIQQVILKRNQGAEIPSMFNILGATDFQNIFDKRYLKMESPLNMTHFEYFNYNYLGKEKIQNDSVHVITAKFNDPQAFFRYQIWISEDNYRLKRVEIISESNEKRSVSTSNFIQFGDTRNLSISQDYSEIENYTFPINFVLSRINNRGVVRISDEYKQFQINPIDLDVKFTQNKFTLADDVDDFKSEDWNQWRTEELNSLETKAYQASDSSYQTYSLWRKFLLGPGMDILLFNYRLFGQKLTSAADIYRYNKVEGHTLGLGFVNDTWIDNFKITPRVSYAFQAKKWNASFTSEFPVSYEWNINAILDFKSTYQPIDRFNIHLPTIETINALFYHENNQNYMRVNDVNIKLVKIISNYLNYDFHFSHSAYQSVKNSHNAALFYPNKRFNPNLNVSNTMERNFGFRLNYEEIDRFDLFPFVFENFQSNGWINFAEINWTFKDKNTIEFKNLEISIFKENKLNKNLYLNFLGTVYYAGNYRNFQNLYFPLIDDFFGQNQYFTLSGFSKYEIAAIDYYSIGTALIINKESEYIPLISALGDLSLSATLFKGSDYSASLINQINLMPEKLYMSYQIGLQNDNILPLRFVYQYNTFKKSFEFRIVFGAQFGN